METKDELIMNVKEWIKIDSEITKLQNELRDRKNKKKQLSELLMIVMKKNEIECFDINGGSLVYKQNKVKKAINAKPANNIALPLNALSLSVISHSLVFLNSRESSITRINW